MKFFLGDKAIPILVHALEYFLNVRFLPEKLFETQPFIKIPVHVVEKLLNFLHWRWNSRLVQDLVPLLLGQFAVTIFVCFVEISPHLDSSSKFGFFSSLAPNE